MAEAISHPLIALIRERGFLDALQIEEIGQEVQRSGKSVVQILQDYGLLDLDSILQIMADHLGTMVVTLEPDTIPPEAIAAVPNETARMYQVFRWPCMATRCKSPWPTRSILRRWMSWVSP